MSRNSSPRTSQTFLHTDIFSPNTKHKTSRDNNSLTSSIIGNDKNQFQFSTPIQKKNPSQNNVMKSMSQFNQQITAKQMKLNQFYGTDSPNNQYKASIDNEKQELKKNNEQKYDFSNRRVYENYCNKNLNIDQHLNQITQIFKPNTEKHFSKQIADKAPEQKNRKSSTNSQLFDKDNTNNQEMERKVKWNDDKKIENLRRSLDINYSNVNGKQSYGSRRNEQDLPKTNFHKPTKYFNTIDNKNYSREKTQQLNAFQKRQRDNNSVFDNFKQKFLQNRVGIDMNKKEQKKENRREVLQKSSEIFRQLG